MMGFSFWFIFSLDFMKNQDIKKYTYALICIFTKWVFR
ncbi:hypothetical protein N643_11740 [Salmonella bongori serovar 48:z41:-- str. RKS3044]|nr:hypothetical protein N643_11740 [Salmonella bongori serovar 48:z41:-- str. RKS3044]